MSLVRASTVFMAVAIAAIPSPAGATGASECRLTVDGKTELFSHVFAVAKENWFDATKEDVELYCFREEVPAEKQSRSELIWVAQQDRIQITVSPDGAITSVNITTPELSAAISGIGFGVELDGARDAEGHLQGEITTTDEMVTLHNGEEGPPWRFAATLDVEVLSD